MSWWNKKPCDKELEYEDEDEIRNLLLYRKIINVKNNTLYLDNGTELEVVANVGCGGCGAGNYEITEINGCDNVITNVIFDCEETDDDYEPDLSYKIFVYAEDKRIKIVQVDGNDGNGYYGSGYTIRVRTKK